MRLLLPKRHCGFRGTELFGREYLLAAIVSLLLCAGTAGAFETEEMTYLGAWPFGPAQAVAKDTERELAFYGAGGAVVVVDVSDPSAPVPLPNPLRTRGAVGALFYVPATQRLFVAGGIGGLEIWDVADPNAAVRLSRLEIYHAGGERPVVGVAVRNDYAYVATGYGYLHWIDVSDPTQPVYIGSHTSGGYSWGLCIDGSRLFVAGQHFASFYIQPDGSPQFLDWHFSLFTGRVDVSGDYAYVTSGADGPTLYVIDTTAYMLPIVGQFNAHQLSDIVVSENVVYLADSFNGLRVLDVTDPTTPVQIGADASVLTFDLCLDGKHLYSTGGLRFHVHDVSDPTQPVERSYLETDNSTYDVKVAGDLAYAANLTGGVYVIDIGNPEEPVRIGKEATPALALDLAVVGDLVYVAAQYDGLRIVDVSDPTQPTAIGSHPTPDYARGVDVAGDIAYVADLQGGLRIFDVSDPGSPMELGAATLPDGAHQVAVAGDYAYVANGHNGLSVVNVSDPNQPNLVGSLSSSNLTVDVCVVGDLIYLADFGGGLRIADISDPENPIQLGVYDPPSITAGGVFADGDLVYVMDASEGVIVVDASDPSSPRRVGYHETPGSAFRSVERDGIVYVADGVAGVQIYRNLVVTSVGEESVRPLTVLRAAPNPSSGPMTLEFDLAGARSADEPVALGIYDIRGRLVRELLRDASIGSGPQRVEWAGTDAAGRRVPAGIYFARLRDGANATTAKLIVVP